MWDKVNDQASERAEQEAKLLELPEKKEEMDKLLDSNSELTWEESMAKYPRANDKVSSALV